MHQGDYSWILCTRYQLICVTQNKLPHTSYNIYTYSHLLWNKSPSSELQECLGKICFPLTFLQLHFILILVCNDWFFCFHTIWVWSVKTLFLLLFQDFILPHPYPIIWLLRLCHLNHALFIQYNELLPPIFITFFWDIF